jgi:hypothetical protein
MMGALQQWLQKAFADPLATARKVSSPVGYVGSDFPLDIALVEERVFCHLPWQRSMPTPLADAWLESTFPGWARSMLQDWADGHFDIFECVVFTRGDDATQRLYYYVCELQRQGRLGGPRALILDVATIPRASSQQHCEQALRTLLAELQLDSKSLISGVARANRQRRLFNWLEKECKLPGHLRENIARAALFHDPLPLLSHLQLHATGEMPRLYLAGSAPPDDSLHRVAEANGWNIVGEMHARSLLRHGEPLELGEDPLPQLASRLNQQLHGPRCFSDRTGLLQAELERTGAQAVVFWLTREDEALVWELAAQLQLCTRMGVASLRLTQSSWDYSDGALAVLARFLKEKKP